jgi:Family of unknown function (DUF6152)
MGTKLLSMLLITGLIVSARAPLWAHHAFYAEFDSAKPLKLRGTVKKVELINPHSWFHIEVKGDDGKMTTWMIEGGSPNALIRLGYTQQSLPVGTEIIVDAFQAKDGSNRACGVDLVYAADGKRLFLGGSAPGANPQQLEQPQQ